MISLRSQYRMCLAALILVASIQGCSAWSADTPSEVHASQGTTKTTMPPDVDRKGGVTFQKQSYQHEREPQ